MPLIVLTGVNGFIGNNLCEKILSSSPAELGFFSKKSSQNVDSEESTLRSFVSVIGSDLPESLSRDTAKRFSDLPQYEYCDYEALFEKLASLPQPPDIIVHNGACSSTVETDQSVFDKLNLNYSKKIWEYCANNNVPLIYASSAAVYGNGEDGFSDQKDACSKYEALNLYGKSKLDFDLWALDQKKTPSTWFGLRYFNVFGPHEEHKNNQASMVYHGFHQAKESGKIKLFESNVDKYEDGEQLRDFVYIDDAVAITKLLIKFSLMRKNNICDLKLQENGVFLNIGTGIANSWNHLAISVFEAIKIEPNIEYIPIPDNIVKQYQNFTCADLSVLTCILPNYNFSVFQDSVKKYVQEYLVKNTNN